MQKHTIINNNSESSRREETMREEKEKSRGGWIWLAGWSENTVTREEKSTGKRKSCVGSLKEFNGKGEGNNNNLVPSFIWQQSRNILCYNAQVYTSIVESMNIIKYRHYVNRNWGPPKTKKETVKLCTFQRNLGIVFKICLYDSSIPFYTEPIIIHCDTIINCEYIILL